MTKKEKEKRIKELKKEIDDKQEEINEFCKLVRTMRLVIDADNKLIEKLENEILFD